MMNTESGTAEAAPAAVTAQPAESMLAKYIKFAAEHWRQDAEIAEKMIRNNVELLDGLAEDIAAECAVLRSHLAGSASAIKQDVVEVGKAVETMDPAATAAVEKAEAEIDSEVDAADGQLASAESEAGTIASDAAAVASEVTESAPAAQSATSATPSTGPTS